MDLTIQTPDGKTFDVPNVIRAFKEDGWVVVERNDGPTDTSRYDGEIVSVE